MNERILIQCIYPAEVTFPNGQGFEKDLKVFAFSDCLAIYRQVGPDVELVMTASATGEYAPMNIHAAYSHQVIEFPTADGPVIIRRGHGCGCGAQALKAFSPQQVDIEGVVPI